MKLGSGSEAWPILRLCARDISQDVGRISRVRLRTPIKPPPKKEKTNGK